jgi:nonsense-mediated mRNA decay protein 3
LVEFTVLNVDLISENRTKKSKLSAAPSKFVLCELELIRTCDLENGDDSGKITVLSHLGNILHSGDLCLGYDLRTVNISGFDESAMDFQKVMLEVVVVKKHFRRSTNPEAKRAWELRRLADETQMVDEKAHTVAQTSKKGIGKLFNDDSEDHDLEQFKRELEEDRELRQNVLLYKKKNLDASAIQPQKMCDIPEGEDEDYYDSDEPCVELAELLEGLTLNDRKKAVDEQSEEGSDDAEYESGEDDDL